MKKTSRSALSAVLAVLGIAAAFPAPAAPAVGTAAPDFTLPAASGASGPVALKDVAAKGKPTSAA